MIDEQHSREKLQGKWIMRRIYTFRQEEETHSIFAVVDIDLTYLTKRSNSTVTEIAEYLEKEYHCR